jgi:hypothetical protein
MKLKLDHARKANPALPAHLPILSAWAILLLAAITPRPAHGAPDSSAPSAPSAPSVERGRLLAPVFHDARLDSLRLALELRLQPWATLPWQAGVTPARRAAAAQGKPVFLIVNTGNVTGFV